MNASENWFYVFNRIDPDPDISTDELAKAVNDFREGNNEAAVRIYSAIYGYIIFFLEKNYSTYTHLYREDLIACCLLGVAEGMRKFDPDKGTVTTWFNPFMRHECENFINSEITHTTQHYADAAKRVRRGEEVSEDTKRALERIEENKKMIDGGVSIESGEEWRDSDTEEKVISKISVSQIFSSLSEKEGKVLKFVYEYGFTEKETAQYFNTPTYKISYIKKKALKKLAGHK